jgi:hypothetical protein
MTVLDTETGQVTFLPLAEVAKDMRHYLVVVIDEEDEMSEVPLPEALAGLYRYGEPPSVGTDCRGSGIYDCPCEADGPDGLCACCRSGDENGSCRDHAGA